MSEAPAERAAEETYSRDPERWVEEHGDALYRYAYVRLRDKASAEDAVQETLLAAFKGQERFQNRYPVRAWLMGILKHKVVDHIRKASREVLVEDQETLDLENSALFRLSGIPTMHPPRWKFSPRRALEQKEFWGVFQGCLAKLQGHHHTAFVLRELEDWTTEEICKELKVTPNHLWVILHRARQQLKSCLEANWVRSDGT